METLTLDLAVYAAMLLGGFVLGTVFGRGLANEFALALGRIEARVAAVEAAAFGTKRALPPDSSPEKAAAKPAGH